MMNEQRAKGDLVSELIILVDSFDGDLVGGLGLGRLEGAGQDDDLGILDLLGHLRVRHFLVEHDAMDELRLLKRATGLANKLDHVQINVTTLKICDSEDSINGRSEEHMSELQ